MRVIGRGYHGWLDEVPSHFASRELGGLVASNRDGRDVIRSCGGWMGIWSLYHLNSNARVTENNDGEGMLSANGVS